jgi:hypothetical protein
MGISRSMLSEQLKNYDHMELISYQKLGNVKFSDNYEEVLLHFTGSKCESNLKDSLNKKQKTIFINELQMLIVFKDEIGCEVEYVEIEKGGVLFNDIDLLKTKYETLEKQFEHMDANLEIEDGGFNAPKFAPHPQKKQNTQAENAANRNPPLQQQPPWHNQRTYQKTCACKCCKCASKCKNPYLHTRRKVL